MWGVIWRASGRLGRGRVDDLLLELPPLPVEPHGEDILCRAESPQKIRAKPMFLVQDPHGEQRGEHPSSYFSSQLHQLPKRRFRQSAVACMASSVEG